MNFTLITTCEQIPESHLLFAQHLAEKMGKDFHIHTLSNPVSDIDLEDYAAEHSVDLFFIYCRNHARTIQQYLNACRNLRLPYVFLTDTMQRLYAFRTPHSASRTPQYAPRILMPVSMLEEEVYKAEIGVHVARFTGGETILLQAKDYGSKAATNVQKIQGLYDKFALPYEVEMAKKDSFSIVKETADRQKEFIADLSILTASRDYGLDDLIFGPVERYAITHSNIPIMLINPRGDLFALCD